MALTLTMALPLNSTLNLTLTPTLQFLVYNFGVGFGALWCAMVDVYSIVVGCSGGVYCLMGMLLANLVLNWSVLGCAEGPQGGGLGVVGSHHPRRQNKSFLKCTF